MNGLLYDLAMAPLERLVLRRWRRQTVGSAPGRVLEVGAGTGRNALYYRCARAIVLTDPDPQMLRRAQRRLRRSGRPALAVRADGERLPFADRSFDAAIVTLALCTAPDPAAVLREIGRILEPGGELRLLEHVRTTSPLGARLQDALTPAWMRVSGGCRLNRSTLEVAREQGFHPSSIHRSLGGWLLQATLHLRPAPGDGSREEPVRASGEPV
jgi:ubiquinone/menaquinone biosynthesis C-methylase UbiE